MQTEHQLLAWLKPVSRSFYLSIRFLPRNIRPTLALAYLLARASDTIADTNGLPAEARLAALQSFTGALDQRSPEFLGSPKFQISPEFLRWLEPCVQGQAPGPEKALLEALPEILRVMPQLPATHRRLVADVLRKIVHGQSLDVERFETGPGLRALKSDAELNEYTYLVAGCVGEFWTKLCCLEWPRYATLPEAQLLTLGIQFGQGLQLTNILRDFPADVRAGRCYLPVADPEALRREPERAREVHRRYLNQAFSRLQAAWTYTGSLRPKAVRFSCALPVLIGVRTLRKMAEAPVAEAGVKVSRPEVRRLMVLAATAAFWPRVHARLSKREFRKL
ncbi:MAG TPA: squalene/phytoene synthase family protein [Chthoniobacterales bacterium]